MVKYFQGGTPIVDTSSEIVHFTARYRLSTGDWRWAKDEFSWADGELCCLSADKVSGNLNDYVQDLSSDVEIESLPPVSLPADPAAEIPLWSLLSSIEAAQTQSAFRTIRLGLPKAFTRWFSLARISRAWLCPRQGKSPLALKEDAIVVSFLRNDGLHLVLLALSLHDVLSIFQSSEEGYVLLQARNDGLSQGEIRVLASVATNFESANAAVVHSARAIVAKLTEFSSSGDEHAVREPASHVESRQYESWYDGFTYCTWNGLGQSLNEQKILCALDTLKTHNVSISSLIIDDNWQSLDNHGDSHFGRRWMEFEANKAGFPNGLKHALEAIRGAHPYIKDVAVWHGIFGYWNATSPNGKIAEQYKTRKVKKQDNDFLPGGHITVVDADDAYRMYDDFYR